jgi:hypothetical protein
MMLSLVHRSLFEFFGERGLFEKREGCSTGIQEDVQASHMSELFKQGENENSNEPFLTLMRCVW